MEAVEGQDRGSVLGGVKGVVWEAFKDNARQTVADLTERTGLKADSIIKALKRHPELFKCCPQKDGPTSWELAPNAHLEVVAVEVTDIVACEVERKEILSQIARWPLPYDTELTARMKIEAISELNRMEGSYPPEQHQVMGAVLIEVIFEERKQAT